MANRFWVGGAGTWDASSTANWSASSGGASGASAPTSSDAAIFDGSSGTGAVVTASGAACASLAFDTSTISFTLGADLAMPGTFTLTSGTVGFSTFTLTALFFTSGNTNVRSIAFGTGRLVLTGNAAAVVSMSPVTNFTFTGTSRVDLTYAGGTGTRTVGIGAGGTEANAMNINVLAGSDNFHSVWVRSLNFTGFTGTWLDTAARTVHGDLTLGAGMSTASGTNGIFFSGTGSQTITSNGVTINTPIEFDGSGGTRTLGDALTLASTRALTFTRGTFNLNNQNMSVGSFLSSNANARTLTLGSGTIAITGAGATAWNTATSTNLTVTASTATISMTSASAKTFAGGAKSWPTLNQGGAGTLTITGANTFADITDTTNGTTIVFPAGVTNTFTRFSLSGAAGSLTSIESSSAGSAATISKASGTVAPTYLSIKDSTATGGAVWSAPTNRGNVDVSGNTGWIFTPVISGAGKGLSMGMGITL